MNATAKVVSPPDRHERTLQRRLREEGATVRSLAGEVRRELSQHLLRVTVLPVSEVAAILRYSDVAAILARVPGLVELEPLRMAGRAEAPR